MNFSDFSGHLGIREDVKYYFAYFVRKGGGGVPPKSVTFILAKILSVKGGGYPPYGQNPQSSI